MMIGLSLLVIGISLLCPFFVHEIYFSLFIAQISFIYPHVRRNFACLFSFSVHPSLSSISHFGPYVFAFAYHRQYPSPYRLEEHRRILFSLISIWDFRLGDVMSIGNDRFRSHRLTTLKLLLSFPLIFLQHELHWTKSVASSTSQNLL